MKTETLAIGVALAIPLIWSLFPPFDAPFWEVTFLTILAVGMTVAWRIDSKQRATETMPSFTPQRMIASCAVFAVGVLMAFKIARFGPYPGVLIRCFVSGSLIFAGIFNAFRRPILGAIVGLVATAVALAVFFVILIRFARVG